MRGRLGCVIARLALVILIAAPPAVRVAAEMGLLPARATDPPHATAAAEKLQADLDATRDSLRVLQAELESSRRVLFDPRFSSVPAQIVPLNDASARRSSLWLTCRQAGTVRKNDAVVLPLSEAEAGSGSAPSGDTVGTTALAGRVAKVFGGGRIVLAQSLLDASFRVRFRHGGVSGMLHGTGRTLRGAPVLELRHVAPEIELREGEPVFTWGEDGLYPPGVLIGRLEREDTRSAGPGTSPGASPGAPSAAELLVVRASVPLGPPHQVLIVRDAVRDDVETLARQEHAGAAR